MAFLKSGYGKLWLCLGHVLSPFSLSLCLALEASYHVEEPSGEYHVARHTIHGYMSELRGRFLSQVSLRLLYPHPTS
jgi:hypothetical protein